MQKDIEARTLKNELQQAEGNLAQQTQRSQQVHFNANQQTTETARLQEEIQTLKPQQPQLGEAKRLQLDDASIKHTQQLIQMQQENNALRQAQSQQKDEAERERQRMTSQQAGIQQQIEQLQQLLQDMQRQQAAEPSTFNISTPRWEGEDDEYQDNWDDYGEEDYRDEMTDSGEQSQAAPQTAPTAAEKAGGNLPQESVQPTSPKQTSYKIREADECKFTHFPNQRQIRSWKLSAKKIVASCSGRPKEAFIWMAKAEFSNSTEELEDDEGFDLLSAKIATGLSKICHGEFQRQLDVLEEQKTLDGKGMLNGR